MKNYAKNILGVQRKTQNNACRAELGRYQVMIKIQKRAGKFYNHLKGSDSKPSITKPSPTERLTWRRVP